MMGEILASSMGVPDDQVRDGAARPAATRASRSADGAARGGYTAANIQVLEGLEAVRRRPGMYIGTTDVRGLHHLVYEVVDNRRGNPVDVVEATGKWGQETILPGMHAGGKFGGGGYKVSGGLNGVGA